jgi:hypothetical protein
MSSYQIRHLKKNAKQPKNPVGNGIRRKTGSRLASKNALCRRRPKSGHDLLNQVIKLTGIPAKHIREELKAILDRKNIDVKNLTLDQLRLVVASYLREIMGNLLDRTHAKRPETNH